jgi:hypothetical protein
MPLFRHGLVAVFLLSALAAAASDGPPHRCGFSDPSHTLRIQRLEGGLVLASDRPVGLDLRADDPRGRFRIHYTLTGPNAVPRADANANGIPDYVDAGLEALDLAFRVQIDSMGFRPPPSDNTDGGSPALDVYMVDLSKAGQAGTGLYGVTRPDRILTSAGGVTKYTSFIEVDNDFAESDRNVFGRQPFATFGVDALKATCVHEFHHTVQIGAYALGTRELMMYEMTATWMELRLYPEIRDWAVYLGQLLRQPSGYPFSRSDASNGYPWGWFGNELSSRFGDAIIVDIWNRIGTGTRPFLALVEACDSRGAAFADIFCQSLSTLYRTGSRARPGGTIPGANELPEIAMAVDVLAIPPAVPVTGSLTPFEVRGFRFTIPADPNNVISTVLLSNTDVTALVNSSDPSSADYAFTVVSGPAQWDQQIVGTTWGLRFDLNKPCSFVDGVAPVASIGPFPQPARRSEHSVVWLPVTSAAPGSRIDVLVTTTANTPVVSFTAMAELRGSVVAVPWTLGRELPTGLYVATVRHNDDVSLHKVVVR